jgi:hypothetical protein
MAEVRTGDFKPLAKGVDTDDLYLALNFFHGSTRIDDAEFSVPMKN